MEEKSTKNTIIVSYGCDFDLENLYMYVKPYL